jgi:hypothetical protein
MVAVTLHYLKFGHGFLSKVTTTDACTFSSNLKSSNIDYIKQKFEYVLGRSANGVLSPAPTEHGTFSLATPELSLRYLQAPEQCALCLAASELSF